MAKGSQQRRVCIFCGGLPLTEEHFWSQWIKNITPKDLSNYHTSTGFESHYMGDKSLLVIPRFDRLSGPLGSKKLKVVCSKCNNEWMSKIDESAKKIFTPIVSGDRFELTEADQIVVSQWAVLKTIIGEYTHLKSLVIPDSEKRVFYETKMPPPLWAVWIGRVDTGKWENDYHHHVVKLLSNTPDNPMLHTLELRPHQSVFVIGNMLLYTLRIPYSEFSYSFLGPWGKKLKLIYPIVQKRINSKDLVMFTKSDLLELKENLSLFIHSKFDAR